MSPRGTDRKIPSKRLVAVTAIAAGLLVVGVFLAGKVVLRAPEDMHWTASVHNPCPRPIEVRAIVGRHVDSWSQHESRVTVPARSTQDFVVIGELNYGSVNSSGLWVNGNHELEVSEDRSRGVLEASIPTEACSLERTSGTAASPAVNNVTRTGDGRAPSGRVTCHPVPSFEVPKGFDAMPAHELSKSFDMPLEQAVTILRFQDRVIGLGRLLRNAEIPGYDDLTIRYRPCYYLSLRMTTGDGRAAIHAARVSKFDELVPYLVPRRATYSEKQLVRAQEEAGDILGDLLTSSDISLTRDRVIVTVASRSEIATARQILADAHDGGSLSLPPDAFEVDVSGPPVAL